MSEARHDPANYRRMCEPHETTDAANEAYAKFYEAVAAARKEHRIKEVMILAELAFKSDDGAEAQAILLGNLGSSGELTRLAAYGYGAARELDRQAQEKFEALGKKRSER